MASADNLLKTYLFFVFIISLFSHKSHVQCATILPHPTTTNSPTLETQLTPDQCDRVPYECSTSAEGENIRIREQYENHLNNIRADLDKMIESLKKTPEASPLASVCTANGGSWENTENKTGGIGGTHTGGTDTGGTDTGGTDTGGTDTRGTDTGGTDTGGTDTGGTSSTSSTTLATFCTVSQWSQWSEPFGFGTQSREREILQHGYICLEENDLQQLRPDFTEHILPLEYNFTLMGINFQRDFLYSTKGNRDILILMDASGSIPETGLNAIKDGINILIDQLCGGFGQGPADNRMAILQFSGDVIERHSFLKNQTAEDLKNSTRHLFNMYGHTCIDNTLREARLMFHPPEGTREGVLRETLLFTDGDTSCPTSGLNDILAAAAELRQSSRIYVIGIGVTQQLATRQMLRDIVSEENPRHIFPLADAFHFRAMMEYVRDDANYNCE